MSKESDIRGKDRQAAKRTVTMADIADELGIAKITVSRALSSDSVVKESTRKRVREAAERMGYRLNVSARNLRQQRSQTIAVVIEMAPSHDRSMREPYPLSLLGGIMQELTSASYNMILTTIDLFASAPPPVDGVILLGQGVHEDAMNIVQRTGLPYTTWGALDGNEAHVTVGSDNLAGGRTAADYLLQRGGRRFVFLGNTGHREIADRETGFSKRLSEAGISLWKSLPCAFTVEGGHRAMQDAIAASDEPVDGVFCANDAIAMGAIHALRDAGFEVPSDTSVVGFDDSPGAAFFQPPLTSIGQNWDEGGVLLARKIISLTAGRVERSFVMPIRLEERAT